MVEVQKRMRHPCFHYNAGSLPTFTIDSYEQSTKLCTFPASSIVMVVGRALTRMDGVEGRSPGFTLTWWQGLNASQRPLIG
jgi:hypothetical protein